MLTQAYIEKFTRFRPDSVVVWSGVIVGSWAAPDPSGAKLARVWRFTAWDGKVVHGRRRKDLCDAAYEAAARKFKAETEENH